MTYLPGMPKQTALGLRRKRLAKRARRIQIETGKPVREYANINRLAQVLGISQTKMWYWLRHGTPKPKHARRLHIILDKIEAKLDEAEE